MARAGKALYGSHYTPTPEPLNLTFWNPIAHYGTLLTLLSGFEQLMWPPDYESRSCGDFSTLTSSGTYNGSVRVQG